MKGRSHRLPTAEPDDWVDGSWTVDCTCGVTFDDGEEMVSCDECGVWVHTRCSRFVKGETSFTCDKCKSKCSRKESEETEVAQLLVELPTKTMRMDSFSARRPFRLWTDIPIAERVHAQGVPGGDPALFEGLSSVFTSQLWKCTGYVPKKFNFQYREFPCWEEKAGGETMPAFGSLIGGEVGMQHDGKIERDDENPVNIGADVLFSLSKELTLNREKYAGSRLPDDWNQEPQSLKGVKKRDARAVSSRVLPNHGKSEKTQFGLQGFQSSKKKREEGSKDQSVKKKTKGGHREGTNKNKVGSQERVHQFRGDAPKMGPEEDLNVALTGATIEVLNMVDKNKSIKSGSDFDEYKNEDQKHNKPKHNVDLSAESVEQPLLQKQENLDDEKCHGLSKSGVSSINSPMKPVVERKVIAGVSVKVEEIEMDGMTPPRNEVLQIANLNGRCAMPAVESQLAPLHSNLIISVPAMPDLPVPKETTAVNSPSFLQSISKVKVEAEDGSATNKRASSPTVNNNDTDVDCKFNSEIPDGTTDSLIQDSPFSFSVKSTLKQVVQENGTSDKATEKLPGNVQESETCLSASLKERTSLNDREEEETLTCGSEKLAQNVVRGSSEAEPSNRDLEELGGSSTLQDGSSKSRHETGGSFSSQDGTVKSRHEFGRSTTLEDGSSKPRHAAKFVAGLSKSSNTKTGSVSLSRHKPISGHGKVPIPGVTAKGGPNANDFGSTSIATGNKQSGASISASMGKLHLTKHREKSNLSIDNKNDDASFGSFGGENSQEMSVTSVKDLVKITMSSVPKTPQARSVISSSTSKHGTLSKQKEQILPPSSKVSPSHSAPVSSGTGNPPVALQEVSSAVKRTPSDSCSKVEKHEECSQPATKLTNSLPLTHAPVPVAATAALSDEELALLLHQELNSSPRVPRISRMRHAGSVPQGTSQTTYFTLVKRPSGSASPAFVGVTDHNMGSRRKTKDDPSREGTRTMLDETRKTNRRSPAQRSQEGPKVDDSTGKDVGGKSSEDFGSARKITSVTASICQSSSADASDQIVTSRRHSAAELSDEDATALAGANTHTLPGLIDEILSKNKEMSYEELCDAVLPHWHNLRKHNGERYAYSSHSHAVLDCLRNRNSWAQLVDRGPKTNLSRKKRKLEPDATDIELETGDGNANTSKLKDEERGGTSEPHQEDVPKGKRRARNYRRLALQSRSLRKKKGKRRPKAVVTDDDYDALSASSDDAESNCSDEESEDARIDSLRSKLATSDESESD